jgi:uncharacterized protein YcbK (DUF882 family)
MQSDTLRDTVAYRRRFLRVLALAGLWIGTTGVLSPAADAATRTKKTALKKRATEYRQASREARARRERRGIERYDPPGYERERYGFVAPSEKTLSLVAPWSGEKALEVPFWSRGHYQPDAIREVAHIMRDWRTGEPCPVDTALLDLLYDLHARLDTSEPFQVVCGYRSPETNAALAERSARVARQSLHMEGRAIDVRLERRPAGAIQHAALSLERGGVGFYPRKGFVHVDTGPVRQWRG